MTVSSHPQNSVVLLSAPLLIHIVRLIESRNGLINDHFWHWVEKNILWVTFCLTNHYLGLSEFEVTTVPREKYFDQRVSSITVE